MRESIPPAGGGARGDTIPQQSNNEGGSAPQNRFWPDVGKGVITAILVAAILAMPFKVLAEWTIKKITTRPAAPPVGTVVASLLPPAQFGSDLEGSWIPLEGQAVPQDSNFYKLTRRETVPDFRGVFVRGLNEFTPNKPRKDEYADPQGAGRNAGSLQGDEFKEHNHNDGDYRIILRKAKAGEDATPHGMDISPGEIHLLDTKPLKLAGGPETRPKNAAVFYYVRIN